LQRAVFDALLAGQDIAAMQPALRARGLLPSGPLGLRALDQVAREVSPHVHAFAEWRGAAQAGTLPVEVEIDGLRLHGRLAEVMPQGIVRLQFGKPSGRTAIRNGLDWLLATAAGIDTPFVEIRDDEERGIEAHPREPISRDAAIEALRALLALRREGLQRPLPFAPYSSWALFAADAPARGVQDAAKKWRGQDPGQQRGWAEGDSDALRLALRGRDPFADGASLREFARIAGLVFGAVTRGEPVAIELGDATLPDDEAEDAE
jgi:exodeoxyribonuclease V gamma subunit